MQHKKFKIIAIDDTRVYMYLFIISMLMIENRN